ncbi:MAG: hypothetical protein II917_08825 [Synergistaceae bacterium]|nr:hypothetical protein [Synergistaceae bacterium]
MSLKTTGNRLIGALGQNVDIAFDPMTGINASWNDNIRKFTYSTENTETTIHLK